MLVRELSKELKITNKELVAFLKDNGYEITNHMSSMTDEMVELAKDMFKVEEVVIEPVVEPVSNEPRKYNQTDLILCRSVCPGWLGMSGKSGQYYVFNNTGDETEVEYQDLYSLKSKKSPYLYAPYIIIEDEELLENPRWADLAAFYSEKVYGADDVEEVLNVPILKFQKVLEGLPKGLKKALAVTVAQKIESGTFDSMKKIKIIDEVCGTDFRHIISTDD